VVSASKKSAVNDDIQIKSGTTPTGMSGILSDSGLAGGNQNEPEARYSVAFLVVPVARRII